MSMHTAPETLDRLRHLVEELSKQASGEGAGSGGDNDVDKPFFDTMCDVFGVDNIDQLLDDYFSTEAYNDAWIGIVKDEDKSEIGSGIRCRVIVAFLSMWKKAILRASSVQTDVERIWGAEFATMNTGYDSLTHTQIKIGPEE